MWHTGAVAAKKKRSASASYRRDVALYVEAGGDETVQRVTAAVHRLARRLNQWYDDQLAELDLSSGEWAVLSKLACDGAERGLSPSELAEAAHVAPSSMTHRLDRMAERDLITRETDPDNRVRVQVRLSDGGWQLFRAAIRESDMLESDVLGPLTQEQRKRLAELLEVVIEGLDNLPDSSG